MARIVHLHKSSLCIVVAFTRHLQVCFLLAAVSQSKIFIFCFNGTSHLVAVPDRYYVYAHTVASLASFIIVSIQSSPSFLNTFSVSWIAPSAVAEILP